MHAHWFGQKSPKSLRVPVQENEATHSNSWSWHTPLLPFAVEVTNFPAFILWHNDHQHSLLRLSLVCQKLCHFLPWFSTPGILNKPLAFQLSMWQAAYQDFSSCIDAKTKCHDLSIIFLSFISQYLCILYWPLLVVSLENKYTHTGDIYFVY